MTINMIYSSSHDGISFKYFRTIANKDLKLYGFETK